MKHILCIQICKLFVALLEMESLAPETRGCRFQWEADQLKFHSRFLHLFHFSARLFLFIHSASGGLPYGRTPRARPLLLVALSIFSHPGLLAARSSNRGRGTSWGAPRPSEGSATMACATSLLPSPARRACTMRSAAQYVQQHCQHTTSCQQQHVHTPSWSHHKANES